MLTTIDQFAGQDIWVYAELDEFSEDTYIRVQQVLDDEVIFNAAFSNDGDDIDEILYGELTSDIDSIEIHPLDTLTTEALIAKIKAANGVTASRQFTKYPSNYVKASRHWGEKTECKTKNGKIVRMQNISSIFNGQDYYILYDADGNFVEKSLDFNDLHDKLYGIKASTSVEASFDINPYMKDLVEYLDYLSDDEIADIKIEHIDDGYAPEGWLEIPEYLRSTVENAVGAELCSPNAAYWYQIEYHPDDDSIVFGINTDLNLETLRGVSKQTEDRFKDKFKKELGESVFSTSTINASSDTSDQDYETRLDGFMEELERTPMIRRNTYVTPIHIGVYDGTIQISSNIDMANAIATVERLGAKYNVIEPNSAYAKDDYTLGFALNRDSQQSPEYINSLG